MFHRNLSLAVATCLMVALLAQARPKDDDDEGKFSVDVNEERGKGTRIDVDGKQEVWRSEDGRSKAEVYGHWDRTYGGRDDGNRNHKVGGRFETTWG